MTMPPIAYVEAMLMMIAADGKFSPEEKEHFRAALVSHPATRHLGEQQIDELIHQAVDRLEREGIDARVRDLAASVTDTGLREQLIHAVVMACVADGEVVDEEMEVLERLQQAFGLPDDRLQAIITDLTNK